MKIALLGDIHGNYRALQAVLQAAETSQVESLLVTGDLVGYYFSPRRVLQLLSEWDKAVVRGNHEDMLAAARLDSNYLQTIEARYGSGIRVAMQELNVDQLNELCTLPHPLKLQIDGMHILLCHGAPWNVDQYIYPDAEAELLGRCASDEFDIVVMGHTHYPMVREVGETVLVNPGSVGQPRNRQSGACWALLDTSNRSITLRCEEYDCSALVTECQQRHPELPYLAEVLQRR